MTTHPTTQSLDDTTHVGCLRPAALGSERVRRGYLTQEERDLIAALLDTVHDVLVVGDLQQILDTYIAVMDLLDRPRCEFAR